MTQSELLQRLAEGEGPLCEFKEAVLSQGELRKVFVAFANTVRSPEVAVLFLGIDDKGKPTGKVSNPDQLQRDLPGWAAKCFPPVTVKPHVLTVDDIAVVAVEVPASRNAPHFPEATYRRVGSQNVEATAEAIDEMIADRTEAVRLLRPWVGREIQYERNLGAEHRLAGRRSHFMGWFPSSGVLVRVDPFGVELGGDGTSKSFTWSQVDLLPIRPGEAPRLRVRIGTDM